MEAIMELVVRDLQKSDIPAAAAVVESNYPEQGATAAAEMEDMFSNATIRPRYVVAESDGGIIGVGGFSQSWMDYHGYEIFWINVIPEYKRLGVGRKIVSYIINEICKDKEAYFIQLSTHIPGYYERFFGFQTVITFGPKNHSIMYREL